MRAASLEGASPATEKKRQKVNTQVVFVEKKVKSGYVDRWEGGGLALSKRGGIPLGIQKLPKI